VDYTEDGMMSDEQKVLQWEGRHEDRELTFIIFKSLGSLYMTQERKLETSGKPLSSGPMRGLLEVQHWRILGCGRRREKQTVGVGNYGQHIFVV